MSRGPTSNANQFMKKYFLGHQTFRKLSWNNLCPNNFFINKKLFAHLYWNSFPSAHNWIHFLNLMLIYSKRTTFYLLKSFNMFQNQHLLNLLQYLSIYYLCKLILHLCRYFTFAKGVASKCCPLLFFCTLVDILFWIHRTQINNENKWSKSFY